MAYLVNAQAGDTLCSIAKANGYSNCGTLRSHPGNAAFLDVPLQVGDQVTVPAFRDSWVYSKIATGRRWTVRWKWPTAAPQPATIQLVRKSAAAPAAAAVLANIGISRFVTGSVTPAAATPATINDWCTHDQRDFNAASSADPCTFSIEVNDPGATATLLPVYLEALQPLYPQGALGGHQRFAPGPIRAERTLQVNVEHLGGLPPGRFWSAELRLVTWPQDKALRPLQALLVSDLDAHNGTDIEILDQRIRAVYEDASCPNAAGERCIKAWHSIPLRRGRSVTLDGYILRSVADGSTADNGLVRQAEYRRRVRVVCRRVFAQEELSFTLGTLRTIDPPSDMLTVADSSGLDSAGNCQQGGAGEVGFTLTYTPFSGVAQVHQVGPIAIAGGRTPMQTAQDLVMALALPGIVAVASQNAPETGRAQGGVDVCIHAVGGMARISNLTPTDRQDSAQEVVCVAFPAGVFTTEQSADIMRKGGEAPRRQLFKSQAINNRHISMFVAQESHGGLTAIALHALSGQGLDTDAAVRNCLTMKAGYMDNDLDYGTLTLPHEIGHALTDADHVPYPANLKSLMQSGPTLHPDGYAEYRISGPGYPPHAYQVIGDDLLRQQLNGAWADRDPRARAPGELDLIEISSTMHDLIAANGSLDFTPR